MAPGIAAPGTVGGMIEFEGVAGVAKAKMQPFHSFGTAIYCARARMARDVQHLIEHGALSVRSVRGS